MRHLFIKLSITVLALVGVVGYFWHPVLWSLLIFGPLIALGVADITQTRQTIRRNFPIIGHFRYLLESVGPELRQYIVTNNNEERPFSRGQRRWVYASSKLQNNYFGFAHPPG